MGIPMSDTGEFLTVNEVARKLRVRPGAVYHWISTGLLQAARLPKSRPGARPQYRIARTVVDELMQEGGYEQHDGSRD